MMNYLAIRYYERKPLPLPCRESLIGMTRRPRRRQIHDLAAALRDAPVPERKSLQLARSEADDLAELRPLCDRVRGEPAGHHGGLDAADVQTACGPVAGDGRVVVGRDRESDGDDLQ